MSFLNKNWKPLSLITFVIISEVIISLFPQQQQMYNGYSYTWGEALYYLFAQIGYVSLLPSLFLYWNEKKEDPKCIYLGLVLWNIIEVIQELNWISKLNINVLDKASSLTSDIMQIIFIIFTVLLIFLAKRCKCIFSLSQFLYRISCTFILFVKGLLKSIRKSSKHVKILKIWIKKI